MLTPSLEHIARAVWRARAAHFWLIWISETIAAATCTAWFVGRARTLPPGTGTHLPVKLIGNEGLFRRRGVIAVFTSFSFFLACYIGLTMIWADFTYYDDSMFTLTTLQGHNILPPIWPGNGRFFPLGHQEFNLIRHFTSSIAGYHAFSVAEILILTGIIVIIDDELHIAARAALAAFALLTPAIVSSFSELVFDDRNILLCLAVFILSVKRFEQTFSTFWALGAVISAQFMVYYKETAFLLLLGFAGGRMVLSCKKATEGWDLAKLRDKRSRLDICLAAVAALFLAYYVLAMFPHPNMRYADQWRLSLPQVILSYLEVDPLAWVLVLIFLGRVYGIWRRGAAPSPLWDALAFGGTLYFAAFLFLRMFASYYLAPVDLIAVLYVGHFGVLSWRRTQIYKKIAMATLVSALLVFEVLLSTFCVYEDKNVVHGKAETALAIQTHLQSPGSIRRLYFPFTSPVLIMQFVSYLNYRGVAVEGVASRPTEANAVVVIGRSIAKDGPCVDYATPICHPGTRPAPGDLVIVLPDDEVPESQAASYRAPKDLVASYEPRPRIPPWLSPVFDRLRIVSPHSVRVAVPDRWLDASVATWR
jgi:hypothetical protein